MLKVFFLNTSINMVSLFGLVTGGFYTDSSLVMSLCVIMCMMTFIMNMALMNSDE